MSIVEHSRRIANKLLGSGSDMKRKHCVVIGAGLAGLAAAFRLIQKGWTVDVLEADPKRLGGRVYTRRFERPPKKPLFYELGGEWIGLQHKRMRELCKHFNLPLEEHRYSFFFWEKGTPSATYKAGELPFAPSSRKAFKQFGTQFRKNKFNDCENFALDQIDWWSKLKQLKFSQTELDRRDLMDSTDFGESIRHTSAYTAATEYFCSNRFDEMDKKIVGGNYLLINALAKAIDKHQKRKSVHLNRKVKRIEQRNGTVKVIANQGKHFPGDACICAIPVPSVHRIQWDPPLPDDQRAAAQRLQYARIMKTAVLFHQKFWPRNLDQGFSLFTNRASDFCFESTFLQEGPEGIICSYAIGDKADDLADEKDDDLARWISEDVSKALGFQPILGEFLHRKPWQRDKCIGGAYAFYRPGQWFTIRPALQRSHRQVAFAGEHLSENWQGFMEGAVETGEAAAEAL
jgi:monoamine oxidase